MTRASIVGIGTWLPDTERTNDAWPPSFCQNRQERGDRTFNDIPLCDDPIAAALVERDLLAEANDPFLGATRRRVADEGALASDAEVAAAARALVDARVDPAQVDLVLSYSIVPDRLTPTASTVAHGIGARDARAFSVDAACASTITQLEIARAYVESGLARVALLVQSHLLLRTMPMEHPASPGLGDAASALVVTRGPGLAIRETFCHTHGEFANAVTWVRGITDATDVPWWKCGGDFRVGSRELRREHPPPRAVRSRHRRRATRRGRERTAPRISSGSDRRASGVTARAGGHHIFGHRTRRSVRSRLQPRAGTRRGARRKG
jgi:3-oxoacyl-[acyl-carrier-protein] synthase III